MAYDEEFNCQDGFDIWLKFIQKYKIKNIKNHYFYRQHNKSLKNESNILKTRNKILIKNIQNKKQKIFMQLSLLGVQILKLIA